MLSGNERRILELEEVPLDQRDLTGKCFYCAGCPKHAKNVRAVAALEVKLPLSTQYYGICAHHAETYPWTEEERACHPFLCPQCYPR